MTPEVDSPQDDVPEWKRRLVEAAADHARRRAEAAAWRREFAARRAHGLKQRHADKLRHVRSQNPISDSGPEETP